MVATVRKALAVLAAFAAICGNAAPISYEFSVTATDGPLAGTTSEGTFAFDSSIVVPGSSIDATGLITDLDFTWNGIVYNELAANAGFMLFDAAGELSLVVFGTNCGAALCFTNPFFESWTAVLPGSFSYSVGSGEVFSGSGSISRISVPEPGSLALLAIALVGAVAASSNARWPRRQPAN
jgi:hypothetical protein